MENLLRQLGAELFEHKSVSGMGATVFLGAGASIDSMIMSWPNMAAHICNRFEYTISGEESPIDVLQGLIRNGAGHELRYSWISPYIQKKTPSLGHQHLAQLASNGYINNIITTNWDCLIEESLSRHILADKMKVYVRGTTPDEQISKALSSSYASNRDVVNVIKLNGDYHSKDFKITDQEIDDISPSLQFALEELFSRLMYVIGTSCSDINMLRLLINAKKKVSKYNLVYSKKSSDEVTTLLEKTGFRTLSGMVNVVTANHDSVNIGGFSQFFTQLNIAVQQKIISSKEEELKEIGSEILSKEQVGLRYINSDQINEQIEHFKLKVFREKPELVVFINDPKAPGGLEIKRRLLPWLISKNIVTHDLEVSGAKGSRAFQRSAKWDADKRLEDNKYSRVVVLDAIAFSGKTLQLAKEKLGELYPNAVIKCGVLVVSKMLVENKNIDLVDFSNAITDRFEIHFPWGVTQTTGTFVRALKYTDGVRHIKIDKRPWGALEELASEESCSVRLLTLEAGTKLSFQRHFCRDELYVALDDHIGLKISTSITLGDDKEPFDEFSPKIQCITLEKGDYILIPKGVWHRPEAYMNRVRILELAFGVYDQVYDIERFADIYSRETTDGSK